MGKVIAAAMMALVALSLVDQHLNYSRYTDATFAVLRQVKHSFGAGRRV
jgi:hypothetical protein